MAVTQSQSPTIITLPEHRRDVLVDYAVKGGLLLLLLWGGKQFINKMKHDAEEAKAGKDPVTQQAMSLRSAMNPSGIEWLKNMDGTDEESIFNVIREVKDMELVIVSYRRLYNSSLMDDLKSEMKVESYNRLLNELKLGNNSPDGNNNKSSLNYSKGLIVVSKAKVNVRKTPRVYGTPATDTMLIYKRSNIIITADNGMVIGITTGRSSFDEKAMPSGVLFIEVQVLKTNAPIKESYTAWVAASQVQTITVEEYKQKRYAALSVSASEYERASSPLNGTEDGVNYQKELIALFPVDVLNEQFQKVGKAETNMILGFPVMELTTKENVFVKFLTLDETTRWVNKKYIKILSR